MGKTSMHLTDKAVAALTVPTGKSEIIVFDSDLPGFGIRLRAGGSRRFIFQYKHGSISRRLTFKESDAARARKTAEKIAARVTLGGDPQRDKAAAKSAASDTFGKVLERYLARPRGKRRDTTISELRRHLLVNLAPLHPIHLKDLTRRRVAEELSNITTERGPVQANRSRSNLIGYLNWCVGEGYTDVNVALGTNRNEEVARDRVLTAAEIKSIWHAAEGEIGDIVKLLLLTALRRDEIGDLRWSEVDLDRRVINIPASRMKNHRPHCVPLTDAAVAILAARRHQRELVFGRSGRGYSGWSSAKLRIDAVAQIEPWRLHDLRRSAATMMAGDCGVLPHVVEVALGHVSGFRRGPAGVYNRADYSSEHRAALESLERHILTVVS
jgi:integrase